MAIRIDVVVVVIDRVHESVAFMHFVGMPIAPCFLRRVVSHGNMRPDMRPESLRSHVDLADFTIGHSRSQVDMADLPRLHKTT